MDTKTFAIITDIHSNLESLNQALKIIHERKDIDQIICLGDCFALGPEPEKTMTTLKNISKCIFIRGWFLIILFQSLTRLILSKTVGEFFLNILHRQ